MTVTNEQEQVVCDFLRKLCPGRDWMYLGEVEHLWIAEMVGAITATVGAGTCHCTTPDEAWCFSCSSCGKSFPRNELNMAHNHGEINYCPNCGKRIEEKE